MSLITITLSRSNVCKPRLRTFINSYDGKYWGNRIMNIVAVAIAVAVGVVLAGTICANMRLVVAFMLVLGLIGAYSVVAMYAYLEWGAVGVAIAVKVGILGCAAAYESSRER